MSSQKTMVQTTFAIGDAHFVLAQGHDVDELKSRIEARIQAGGGFVEFVVVGNRTVSVYMTDHERIVITKANVVFDERDTGDIEAPYGGYLDVV